MELALSRLSAALGECARGTASPNHRGRSVSQPFATTPLRRLFPMAELGIRELQYHQQVQELLNQRIDIGYVPIRFPELESELVFECVRKAPFLVALPTEHPLAKQRRLRLSALVARQLAENPDVSVLLLEAGGSDDVPSVIKAGQCHTKLGSERDWAFHVQ